MSVGRVLITGVAGFTGRYMAAELARAGYTVLGLAGRPVSSALPDVTAVEVCDLCDESAVAEVVDRLRPDYVVHLAGIAHVAHGDTDAIYRTNLLGSRHLLEALCRPGQAPRAVLLASSANVYGNARGGVLTEDTVPAPANDYAVSKLAMEHVARLFGDRLPVIIARPFNYTGIGQDESFLIPKIVGLARRRAPVIELGNLDVARDFSDVRTVANYYRRLLECPSAIGDTFNVCSGRAYTLEEVLDIVRGLSGHDFEIRVNPKYVRSNEVKILVGSRAKLEAAVGRTPDVSLRETIAWMLADGN